MNLWQYLNEVYGVENFISRSAVKRELANDESPTPSLFFLTPETEAVFQSHYKELFSKISQAMGLREDQFQIVYEHKTFLPKSTQQVLFDSSQPMGWRDDSCQLVVSSLSDLQSNMDAKKKSWQFLKGVTI